MLVGAFDGERERAFMGRSAGDDRPRRPGKNCAASRRHRQTELTGGVLSPCASGPRPIEPRNFLPERLDFRRKGRAERLLFLGEW